MEHQRLLELTASRMAIAIENARLYTRVSRQAQTLSVLNDISREITSILDTDDLLERIGQLLKRVIDFHMFSILLWNDRTQLFEHRFSSRYGERVTRGRTIALGEGLIGTAAVLREPILAPDVRKDSRYVEANPEVRSELAIPLVYKGEVIGVLDLEHTRVNYYNDDHQRTLSTLASQVAISIANARLYQRIHEEEQRMERDLDMARQVQLRLMPSHPPKLERAEIASRFVAARSIGGDVFDYLDYGSGRIAIAVGDVSGKAAPAALYAALVSGILRSLAPQHLSPAAMLAALNDQLQERKLDSQYVTMLMAVWDDNNQTLQIANAGSVQPLFVAANSDINKPPSVRTIQAEGFPSASSPTPSTKSSPSPPVPATSSSSSPTASSTPSTAPARCSATNASLNSSSPSTSPPRSSRSTPSCRPSPIFRPALPILTTRPSSSSAPPSKPPEADQKRYTRHEVTALRAGGPSGRTNNQTGKRPASSRPPILSSITLHFRQSYCRLHRPTHHRQGRRHRRMKRHHSNYPNRSWHHRQNQSHQTHTANPDRLRTHPNRHAIQSPDPPAARAISHPPRHRARHDHRHSSY
ncbi:PP2C family protein-serine/threonine phosphatase [Tunturiibacter gelidiferens]|uniref:PP2C family protein-serine/threonine phosphatase n=1 Tax=Tunturiibacter gelidiferens TaxID=3069689 RepID=UPI003D9BC47E